MKTLLKLAFLFCFLFNFAQAKEIKFIHITDIGLNPKNAYKLQRTIKEINDYKDIDFVVFGGNNLQKPNFENLDYFLYLLKKVKKKSYVLLGSNDVSSVSGLDKEFYLKKVKKARFFKHSKVSNYSFNHKDYVFIVMDGTKQYFQSSNGFYSKNELDFLDKTLEKNRNKNVIILQHFPLLQSSSKWLETAKTDEYYQILDKYKNVKVIISGHYGDNLEIKKDGIYHIITESYSKECAYKVIELDLEKDYVGTYLVK